MELRNELTHYKSKWGRELSKVKLMKSLANLRHRKPAFVQNDANFFPAKCLSGECAAWAVKTAVDFLTVFYQRLGIVSPLDPYIKQFSKTIRTKRGNHQRKGRKQTKKSK